MSIFEYLSPFIFVMIIKNWPKLIYSLVDEIFICIDNVFILYFMLCYLHGFMLKTCNLWTRILIGFISLRIIYPFKSLQISSFGQIALYYQYKLQDNFDSCWVSVRFIMIGYLEIKFYLWSIYLRIFHGHLLHSFVLTFEQCSCFSNPKKQLNQSNL